MPATTPPEDTDADRRTAVLRSAMVTFARYGYRKTSMEQVAHDASISRQGLYFLFESKPVLFQQAVEQTVRDDLAAARCALEDRDAPLDERLVRAFDHWAGRYVGPLSRDVSAVVEDNPSLVGPWARSAPEEFARLVVTALAQEAGRCSATRVGPVLLSASVGIKHQVGDREAYLDRLRVAVAVVLEVAAPGAIGRRGLGDR